ncbi:MAG TPA: hypothetical protein DIW44_15405 [Anaerolineaceae bacterium]|nr:hypothetical protein [Anaerolineaceae bacterium]
MKFKVTYNETTQIIEARIQCDFDWNLVEHLAPEICKFVNQTNSDLIFLDFRKSKVEMSTIKIYETPRKIAEEFAKTGVDIRELKRAILIKPGQKDFDFLESVTVNNAQIFSLFYDEESAIKWLVSLRKPKNG